MPQSASAESKRLTTWRIGPRSDEQINDLRQLYGGSAAAIMMMALDRMHTAEHTRLHQDVKDGKRLDCPFCGWPNKTD